MQSNFSHKFVVTGVYLGCCRSALLTDTETLVTEWLHAKSAHDVIQLRCNCYVFSFICNETIKLINIWIFFPRCNCFYTTVNIYIKLFTILKRNLCSKKGLQQCFVYSQLKTFICWRFVWLDICLKWTVSNWVSFPMKELHFIIEKKSSVCCRPLIVV